MNINEEFKNKKVLITGASKGLGKEISIHFEKIGCKLSLCARSRDLLESIEKKFSEKNKHLLLPCDLLDDNLRSDALDKIKNFYECPDIIIHCLGGSLGYNSPDEKLENFFQSLKGNLGIAVDINNKFIPFMKKRKSGNIIHISSVVGNQVTASVPYVTSKSSISAYVRGMGNYLADFNITLSGIMPGAFIADDNAMARFKKFKLKEYNDFVDKLPQKRMPHAQEYINLIKLLSSNNSQIFSGSMIPVDTGQGLSIS